MNGKHNLGLLVFMGVGFALSASAQIDEPGLRSKYGAPDSNGIFTIPPAIAMKVDFGTTGQVCKLELSSGLPSKQDDALTDLVPMSMRGKELGKMVAVAGRLSLLTTEYERVIILEYQNGGERTGLAVTFETEGCPPLRRSFK